MQFRFRTLSVTLLGTELPRSWMSTVFVGCHRGSSLLIRFVPNCSIDGDPNSKVRIVPRVCYLFAEVLWLLREPRLRVAFRVRKRIREINSLPVVQLDCDVVPNSMKMGVQLGNRLRPNSCCLWTRPLQTVVLGDEVLPTFADSTCRRLMTTFVGRRSGLLPAPELKSKLSAG